jgi:hypothetical protein
LRECCEILEIRSGLKITVSKAELTAAHTHWKQDCALWLEHLLPKGTKRLSHLKRSAVLLHRLCELAPISVGSGKPKAETPPSIQDGDPQPPLPNQLEAQQIQKFKDGGCHYIAWLICYHLCEFFERHRSDRIDKFEARITEEFEFDMVSGLLSAKLSAQAIHIILKALFLRD